MTDISPTVVAEAERMLPELVTFYREDVVRNIASAIQDRDDKLAALEAQAERYRKLMGDAADQLMSAHGKMGDFFWREEKQHLRNFVTRLRAAASEETNL